MDPIVATIGVLGIIASLTRIGNELSWIRKALERAHPPPKEEKFWV